MTTGVPGVPSARQPIDITDVERLALADSPELVTVIEAYLAQFDADEEEYDDDGNEIPKVQDEVPEGTITLDVLKQQLRQSARKHEKKARSAEAFDAWKRYLAQDPKYLAPQLKLADVITGLYERGGGSARATLLAVIQSAPLAFGVWGGVKRVMKRAEAGFDAEVLGAIAARVDLAAGDSGDVSRGTQLYLRRRLWRYLRDLGKASPELYPQFCVEVLRHYPAGTDRGTAWIGGRIAFHNVKKWGGWKPERSKKFRAPYVEAWKRSADPLLLLLETCASDFAAGFAIDGLKELFPDVLRAVTPEWLGRLMTRPLESANDFVVEMLEASPELHQGKLKGLGLHESVLAMLDSPSAKARKYAIEYARAHATDMPAERLADLLDSNYQETTKFAATALMAHKPRELGAPMLVRLIRHEPTRKWASGALESDFDKNDVTQDLLVELLLSDDDEQSEWVQKFIKKKFQPRELPPAFWIRVVDDKRFREYDAYDTDYPVEQLLEYPIASMPAAWLFDALQRSDIGDQVIEWLEKADALPPGLDVERLKGMIFDARKRQPVMKVLGNTKLVPPQVLGLGWLLALARRADPALHEWAHRYLLQYMKPEHFAEGHADAAAGTARLFQLALGPKEPEAVRAFAQTYLRCHHPTLGREQPETKQFGIKPALSRAAYTMDTLWPALWDNRADVRKFAATVARVELRRWNAQGRVYELAESPAKEVRNIAYDALMQAGEPDAPDLALALDDLDAAQIFSMTESRKRSTRDVAMELIRKHYKLIGGAERLGWLMQSADREVRLFAVRLLWEKHRPRGIPAGWKPSGAKDFDLGEQSFADVEALRGLLRRLLFLVPPLRSAEQVEKQRARKLPASVAKLHVIEIVRDFGVRDAAFATLVAPVLAEFTGSLAKGEWSACLSALMTLRNAHGIAVEGMVS